MYLRKILQYTFCVSVIPVLAIFIVTYTGIGLPRKIDEHWVHPRVDWYLTGHPPLGFPYPSVVHMYTLMPEGAKSSTARS